MDITHIESTLIQVHQDIQTSGGFASATVQASTCPLLDLPGFDSLLIPVVFRRVARKLGVTLPADYRVPNLYVTQGGRRRLTIAEIAGEFFQRFSAKAA
ncbi:hypothetical protein [Hyalangium sp.]|uniref:hypothetical protein n=1 Tax=Hyalangium sp. TaxID=2028555 RepID=UPI002D2C4AAC|nr:hypothetical protein [Hyalangium sp.]HYH95905.1 hypothetical protein [Hyalangium sp.]